MTRESKKKIVTKKHLARIERERLQARYILFASVFVIVVVIGLIGYGILDKSVLTPLKPVAEVNGDKISLKEFQTRVRYMRQNTIQRAQQTYQIMQMFAQEPQFQQYYLSSLQQLNQQLEPTILGQQVLDGMVEEKLILQEAKRRNITASKEEVDKLFQEYYGFFANGTPTPSPTVEEKPTSTLNPTQKALMSPTPTATATATPTATITATLTLTATPTLASGTAFTPTPEVTATAALTATPVVTQTATPEPPTATPTPYTLEEFQKNYQDSLKTLEQDIQFSEADYRALAEMQIITEKVRDAVLADLKPDQDEVWMRIIKNTTKEGSQSALDAIQKGEDFGAVASKMSEDVASNTSAGDVGWLNRYDVEDKYGEAVAKLAFENLKIGEISQVVEGEAATGTTTGAYYIIQLLGHEVRTLSPSDFDQLRQTRFQKWIDDQKAASKVETTDIWIDRVPTEPSMPVEIQQLLQQAAQNQTQP